MKSGDQKSIIYRSESEVLQHMGDTTKPEDDIRHEHLQHTKTTPTIESKTRIEEKKTKPKRALLIGLALSLLFLVIAGGTYWFLKYRSPALEPPFPVGQIQITSNPIGAHVLVNKTDTKKTTPTLLTNLALNEPLTIRLEAKGFQTWKRTLTLTNDQVIVQDIKLIPQPEASFTIGSQPKGAHIILDGHALEQLTPFTIDHLEIGKTYHLRITKKGFKPFEKEITPADENPIPIDVKLEKIAFASLLIDSDPQGAQIFINNQDTGMVSPSKIEKLEIPRVYELSLKKENYEDEIKTINLEKPKTVSVKLTLNLIESLRMVKIKVNSNVPNAKVMVNGKPVGFAPGTFEVKPGKIKIQISKKGYQTESRTLALSGGTEKKLSFQLIRKESPQKKDQKIPEKQIRKGTRPTDTRGLYGEIRIDSRPRGASVVIDGKKAGITPISISRLSKGASHTITLNLPGYRQWTKTFNLGQNHVEFMADLSRK